MALTSTQLAAAITSSQTLFSIANGAVTGAPVVGALPLPMGIPIQIDSEIMFWIAQPAANICQVRGRGSDGTAPAAHDILSNVYIGANANDFPSPQPGTFITTDFAEDSPISLGQDQTVTPSGANAVYNINKATAAALTLSAPNLADNGVALVFTSQTAMAHVITATSLIQDGSSGVPRSTLTFAAQKGASVTLIAENGLWNVSALQNVTAS